MPRFLIIEPTGIRGRAGRGVLLAQFLRVYFGRPSTEIVTVADLEKGRTRTVDYVLVGIPTTLHRDLWKNVRSSNVAFFDYTDIAGPEWHSSDQTFLRTISTLYLKPWVESAWDFGLRWGVLPIRRRTEMTWHFKILRTLFASKYPDIMTRDHDVSFLGNCTSYFGTTGENRYAQRVEWMEELHQAGDRFTFWGGLHAKPILRARLEKVYGDLSHLLTPGRRRLFTTFFRHLLRSKVVLTPTGNARWSYRHYEAIYAGAILVSTDFRTIRTLIPLPLENMIHVADHESVIPAIEMALELRRRRPEVPRQNIEFLERYLTNSDYDPSKPQLAENFLAQFSKT